MDEQYLLRIIAVEPEGADAMIRSLREKRRVTLAAVSRFAEGVAVDDVAVRPPRLEDVFLELVGEGAR